MAMNDIVMRQNQPDSLDVLKAQRNLYSRAKLVLGIRLIVSALLATGLTLTVIRFPAFKIVAALLGFSLTLLDLFVLGPWQERVQKLAARVQELFDSKVLDIPWNKLVVGARPEPEDLVGACQLLLTRRDSAEDLMNWYPCEVTRVPECIGRIICQRANLWWDAGIRKVYGGVLVALLILMTTACIVFGLGTDATLDHFFLGVLMPLQPMLIIVMRYAIDQWKAAKRLDALRTGVNSLWEALLSNEPDESELTHQSRLLQDAIFGHRGATPLVFDSLYRFLRSFTEDKMNKGAESLVAEYLASKNPGLDTAPRM